MDQFSVGGIMSQQPFPGALVPAVGSQPFNPIWILFFQQFSQQPGAITPVVLGASPASYTASGAGTLVLNGGTITDLKLTRSGATADLGSQRSVLMANNDVARVTYTGSPAAQFIPG